MQTLEDIETKLSEIEKALENLHGEEGHFKTVYEAQIYILSWVVQKE